MKKLLGFLIFAIFYTISANATITINVGSEGFDTITAALNSLPLTIEDDYQILVADNIYYENLNIDLSDFGNHSLTLQSTSNSSRCIIEGNSIDNVVNVVGSSNSNAPFTIKGFTIRNDGINSGCGIKFQLQFHDIVDSCTFDLPTTAIIMNLDCANSSSSSIDIINNVFLLGNSSTGIQSTSNSVIKRICMNKFISAHPSNICALNLQSDNEGQVIIEDNYFEASVFFTGLGLLDSEYNLRLIRNVFSQGTCTISECKSSIMKNIFFNDVQNQTGTALSLQCSRLDAMIVQFADNYIYDFQIGIVVSVSHTVNGNFANVDLRFSNSVIQNCYYGLIINQDQNQSGHNRISSLHSCIFANNDYDFRICDSGGITTNLIEPIPISYSCFSNEIPVNGTNFTLGLGNIEANPSITVGTLQTSQPYYLNWNPDGPSPCIDTGKPLDPTDPPRDGENGTPPDMGVYPFVDQNVPAYTHKIQDYFYPNNDSGIYWCSFPVLDDRTYLGGSYRNEIQNVLYKYWHYNPITLISAQSNYELEFNDFHFYNGEWQDDSLRVNAPLGFKVLFNTPNIERLNISGLYPEPHTTTLALTPPPPGTNPVREYWLGWFPEETQNIMDAFRLPIPGNLSHTYLDYLYEIKYQKWAAVRVKPQFGSPWIISYPVPTISYREMVTVKEFNRTDSPSQMFWNIPSTSRPPVERQKAEAFTYTEKMDYLPVFVALDDNDLPLEVGISINGVCKGAAKVESDTLEINAYLLDESRADPDAEIEIIFYYGDRGLKSQHNWSVFNPMTMVFEKKPIYLKDLSNYLFISFTADSGAPLIPLKTALAANYPNPFNPETHISFSLAKEMQVKLFIYNCRGQIVRTLVHGLISEGQHEAYWDGKDDTGRKVASGIYIYRLETPEKKFTKKMLLLK